MNEILVRAMSLGNWVRTHNIFIHRSVHDPMHYTDCPIIISPPMITTAHDTNSTHLQLRTNGNLFHHHELYIISSRWGDISKYSIILQYRTSKEEMYRE